MNGRILKWVAVIAIMIASANADAASYSHTYKKWTKDGVFYGSKDFFAKLEWVVTYFSSDFLQARYEEYSQKMKLSSAQKQIYWQESIEPYTRAPYFFVAMYTESKKWNELEPHKDPIWKLSLHQGDLHCEPTDIQRIGKLNSEEGYFFPSIERWHVPYRVGFSPSCRLNVEEPFELRIDGLYGRSSLEWNK